MSCEVQILTRIKNVSSGLRTDCDLASGNKKEDSMAKKDNRTTGNRFEQGCAKVLSAHRFWAHVMQQNKAGQPADIIAVKGKFHTLIDCKVISDNKGFPFERIEDNQRQAMKMFFRKGGELCYFALKLPDNSIWMVSLERLDTFMHRGMKRLSDDAIHKQTWSLEKWLESSDIWSEDT